MTDVTQFAATSSRQKNVHRCTLITRSPPISAPLRSSIPARPALNNSAYNPIASAPPPPPNIALPSLFTPFFSLTSFPPLRRHITLLVPHIPPPYSLPSFFFSFFSVLSLSSSLTHIPHRSVAIPSPSPFFPPSNLSPPLPSQNEVVTHPRPLRLLHIHKCPSRSHPSRTTSRHLSQRSRPSDASLTRSRTPLPRPPGSSS